MVFIELQHFNKVSDRSQMVFCFRPTPTTLWSWRSGRARTVTGPWSVWRSCCRRCGRAGWRTYGTSSPTTGSSRIRSALSGQSAWNRIHCAAVVRIHSIPEFDVEFCSGKISEDWKRSWGWRRRGRRRSRRSRASPTLASHPSTGSSASDTVRRATEDS